MLEFTDTLLEIVQIARALPMHLTGVCVNESKSDQLRDYIINTWATT
jgi:hypothetical protein